MDKIKLNVRALAAQMKMNIEELATNCGINPTHLKNVSCGRVKMTAKDLQALAAFTGVPADNIQAE